MERQDAGVRGGKAGRMVVGLDIDDTITRHPRFFAFLTRALVAAVQCNWMKGWRRRCEGM
jgi:hypothetical protein